VECAFLTGRSYLRVRLPTQSSLGSIPRGLLRLLGDRLGVRPYLGTVGRTCHIVLLT
jgi:hypothetical protein